MGGPEDLSCVLPKVEVVALRGCGEDLHEANYLADLRPILSNAQRDVQGS